MFRDDSFWGPLPGVPFQYENYFIPGPNPAPGLQTTEYMNPARSHAPIAENKPWYEQDDAGADPAIQRVPQTPDGYQEVPGAPVFAPAGGIIPPAIHYQAGWSQHFVPEMGRRPALQAHAPLVQVSRPIRSYTGKSVDAISQPHHRLMRVRAPKAKD